MATQLVAVSDSNGFRVAIEEPLPMTLVQVAEVKGLSADEIKKLQDEEVAKRERMRGERKSLQPDLSELTLVHQVTTGFDLARRGQRTGQLLMSRPDRFTADDLTDNFEEEWIEYTREVERLKTSDPSARVDPSARQRVFWADYATKAEVLRFNQYQDSTKGGLVGTLVRDQDFLMGYIGPLFIPGKMSVGQMVVDFHSPAHLRVTDLFHKDVVGENHVLPTFGINALRLAFDNKLAEEKEKLGAHVALWKALVVDACVTGVKTPLEVALTTTVAVDHGGKVVRSGRGQEYDSAFLAHRELVGTEHRAPKALSTTGQLATGDTTAHLLVTNSTAQFSEEQRTLASTNPRLFANPWVSRAMFANFVDLRLRVNDMPIAKDTTDSVGGYVFDAPVDFCQSADLLQVLILSHVTYLRQKLKEHLKQAGVTLATDRREMEAFVNVEKTAVKVKILLHKPSLLDMLTRLENECRKADTLLNLHYFGASVHIPHAHTQSYKTRMSQIAEFRDPIDSNPHVSYHLKVGIKYWRLNDHFDANYNAFVRNSLSMPLLTKADFGRGGFSSPFSFKLFYPDHFQQRSDAADAKADAKADDRVQALFAQSGVSQAGQVVHDREHWERTIQEEYQRDVGINKKSPDEAAAAAKDRALAAPTGSVEQSTRLLAFIQLSGAAKAKST